MRKRSSPVHMHHGVLVIEGKHRMSDALIRNQKLSHENVVDPDALSSDLDSGISGCQKRRELVHHRRPSRTDGQTIGMSIHIHQVKATVGSPAALRRT